MADYNAMRGSAGQMEGGEGGHGQPIQSLQIPAGYGGPGLAYPASYLQQASATPQQGQLRAFWQEQMQEIHQVGTDPAEFKNHQLPLARIKKIMKSDEDVRMISAEAPVLFAKACEMFILELTLRSWNHSEENKRRTLQRNDISAAITRTDIFDFLVDIVPREEQGDDGPSSRPAAAPAQYQNQQGGANWAQQAPPPNSTGALPIGDIPSMGRSQQAVDPAVMQFYMQQPQSNPSMNMQGQQAPPIPNFILNSHSQAQKDSAPPKAEPPTG